MLILPKLKASDFGVAPKKIADLHKKSSGIYGSFFWMGMWTSRLPHYWLDKNGGTSLTFETILG